MFLYMSEIYRTLFLCFAEINDKLFIFGSRVQIHIIFLLIIL